MSLLPTSGRVAYQGEPGSNSDTACREMLPGWTPVPCTTFDDAFTAVHDGLADMALIPVENSLAGRVADPHQLLPESGLAIVGEWFLPIHFHLMVVPGARVEDIRTIRSHTHAFGQCRALIREHGWAKHVSDDTAGAAREVAELGDPSVAALAPRLAADLYGLDELSEDVEDATNNATRFLLLAPEPVTVPDDGPTVTTIVFRVRNVPAALYKGLGGFATNGVNITKLESYQLGGTFFASQFYADIDGHPDDPGVALALEELAFFCVQLRTLGTYPAHPYREAIREPEANRTNHPVRRAAR